MAGNARVSVEERLGQGDVAAAPRHGAVTEKPKELPFAWVTKIILQLSPV